MLPKSAQKENLEAQRLLGHIYLWDGINKKLYTGDKQPKSYSIALSWLEKAAIRGHCEAQRYLGVINFLDFISTKNYKESQKWFKRAAKQGDELSRYALEIHFTDAQKDPTIEKWRCKEIMFEAIHGELVELLKDLAEFYKNDNKYEEAEAIYRQIIAYYEPLVAYYEAYPNSRWPSSPNDAKYCNLCGLYFTLCDLSDLYKQTNDVKYKQIEERMEKISEKLEQ